MAETSQAGSSEPASGQATPRHDGKKEIKILMLHGYTQSGALFRAKTRALEKSLHKALAPLGLSVRLIYPTAPNRLQLSDLPGYGPRPSTFEDARDPDPDQDQLEKEDDHGPTSDAWAWWRKDEATGAYRLLDRGMMRLAEAMRAEEGGVDGVVGFSQGASAATMLAALLETGRAVPPESEWGPYSFGFVPGLREANHGRPLRFAVAYSGFYAPVAELAWLYEPRVATPTLHFLGSLDVVVDESRSRGLVERCQDAVVVVHPGGHYVPVSREWVAPLVGFVRRCCCVEDQAGEKERDREGGVASQL